MSETTTTDEEATHAGGDGPSGAHGPEIRRSGGLPRNIRLSTLWPILLGAFFILLVGREFGIADNGDFARYFGPYVSAPVEFQQNWPRAGTPQFDERFFNKPHTYWYPAGIMPPDPTWPASSHVFWTLGRWLNDVFFSGRVVNLQVVALPFFLVHFAFFALSVFWLERISKPLVCWLAALVLFGDVAFTSFYTTFYAEGTALLMMFGLACAFLWGLGAGRDKCFSGWPAFSISLALSFIVLAKPQYYYMMLPAIGVVGSLAYGAWRIRSMLLEHAVAVALLCVTGFLGWQERGQISEMKPMGWPDAQHVNAFHSLYDGVLEQSPDRARLLSELNLPASSISLIGADAFTLEADKFMLKNPEITQAVFLKAVVLEPMDFVNVLKLNAGQLGVAEPTLFEVPGASKTHFPIFLSPAKMLFSWVHGIPLLLAALIAGLVNQVLIKRLALPSKPLLASMTWLFMSVIPLEIVTSTFDGHFDVRKHLILADLCAFILVVTLVVLASVFRQRVAPREAAEELNREPLFAASR